MSKKAKEAEGKTAVAEKPVETKEPEKTQVTSTELAKRLGTKPTILRRWLRTLPRFQDNGYTRYKWDEDDQFLKDAAASFEKYQKQSEEKKEARLAEAREKAEKAKSEKPAKEAKSEKPAKEAKPKKSKKEEPAEEEEKTADDEFEESEEGEELE